MKKLFSFFLALIFVLCLFGCGSKDTHHEDAPQTLSSQPKQDELSFDLDFYMQKISSAHKRMMDAAVYLSNFGTYEFNYWESLENIDGQIDHDSMLDSASEWLQKRTELTLADLASSYDTICADYKEIVTIETDDNVAAEIFAEYKTLFTSYDSLYRLVTSPSGNLNSFSQSFNESIRSIKSSDSMLSILLSSPENNNQ